MTRPTVARKANVNRRPESPREPKGAPLSAD
jgi:hypothetical protein